MQSRVYDSVQCSTVHHYDELQYSTPDKDIGVEAAKTLTFIGCQVQLNHQPFDVCSFQSSSFVYGGRVNNSGIIRENCSEVNLKL